ncbi:hypothetical protein MMAD_46630 [Mycolicibacterium madagascariense]|uniref:Uncharacterized protein n=1 Tax=Mycolicibacterium madagascariense TaxID=212765 RepID=A0A7I7XMA1_9MYCO|nr:hypothetical protein MMAD_46630 [Mycolicibacterium madagascariense]
MRVVRRASGAHFGVSYGVRSGVSGAGRTSDPWRTSQMRQPVRGPCRIARGSQTRSGRTSGYQTLSGMF